MSLHIYRTVIFLLIFISYFHSYSQNIDYGGRFNFDDKFSIQDVVATKGDRLVYLTTTYRGILTDEIRLMSFDKSLQLSKDLLLEKKGKKEPVFPRGITYLNETLYLFATNNKSGELSVQEYNPENLELIGEQKTLITRETDLSGFPDASRSMYVVNSEDRTKVAIFEYVGIKNKWAFRVSVFDNKLNMLWESEKEFSSNSDDYVKTRKIVLDNEGNVYQYDKMRRGKKRKGYGNFFFVLRKYSKDGTNKEYRFEQEGVFLEELKMFIDNKSQELIFGDYFSKKNNGSNLGTFYAKLDIEDLKVAEIRTEEFPKGEKSGTESELKEVFMKKEEVSFLLGKFPFL